MSSPSNVACGVAVAMAFLAHPVSAASLLLRYGFDEVGSGGVAAADLGTGTPAPGVFVGGATRTPNTPNSFSTGALDLTVPGAGTYVDGGDADKLDGLGSFTLTAWINLQGDPATNLRIMSKQTGGSFDGFTLNIADPFTGAGTRTASNFGLRMFIGGTTAFAFDPATTGLSIDADNKWAFIAVTYDGSLTADNVKYYVGSVPGEVLLAATTSINAGSVLPNAAKFGVGYTDAAPASDTAPPAFMDDVRVYDGTLSSAELEAVRLANIPEPSTGLLILSAGSFACLKRRRKATPSER